jgi:hypothetical protein
MGLEEDFGRWVVGLSKVVEVASKAADYTEGVTAFDHAVRDGPGALRDLFSTSSYVYDVAKPNGVGWITADNLVRIQELDQAAKEALYTLRDMPSRGILERYVIPGLVNSSGDPAGMIDTLSDMSNKLDAIAKSKALGAIFDGLGVASAVFNSIKVYNDPSVDNEIALGLDLIGVVQWFTNASPQAKALGSSFVFGYYIGENLVDLANRYFDLNPRKSEDITSVLAEGLYQLDTVGTSSDPVVPLFNAHGADSFFATIERLVPGWTRDQVETGQPENAAPFTMEPPDKSYGPTVDLQPPAPLLTPEEQQPQNAAPFTTEPPDKSYGPTVDLQPPAPLLTPEVQQPQNAAQVDDDIFGGGSQTQKTTFHNQAGSDQPIDFDRNSDTATDQAAAQQQFWVPPDMASSKLDASNSLAHGGVPVDLVPADHGLGVATEQGQQQEQVPPDQMGGYQYRGSDHNPAHDTAHADNSSQDHAGQLAARAEQAAAEHLAQVEAQAEAERMHQAQQAAFQAQHAQQGGG